MAKRTIITNEQRIKYFNQENRFQKVVYRGKISAGKMTPKRANMQIQIILESRELIEKLQSKGYSFYDLMKFLDDIPDKESQSDLFTQS